MNYWIIMMSETTNSMSNSHSL